MRQSAIRILEVEPHFSEERARTPLKFGAVVMDAITYCHVRARVETGHGQVADGWGSMFLADMWGWPSEAVPHDQRNAAMRAVTEAYCRITAAVPGYHHPLDLFVALETDLGRCARDVAHRLGLAEAMPQLCALICAAPVDAALHDAFGLANGIGTYDGYGAELMPRDLSAYLGPAFAGRYPADFLRSRYAPTVPVFHLVGGLDKLRRSEVETSDPDDGLPNSLDDWVARDGLTKLKVKLQGTDLAWDTARTIEVVRVAQEVLRQSAPEREGDLRVSADTNEQCPDPQYVLDYLHGLRERAPDAYDALLYVEQPTERDLTAHRWDMRPIAALKPVIVDESLAGLADYDLARELGWSGVAIKVCKGQSGAILVLSRAAAEGVPYTIQDLTNPGLALIQSVGLAARCGALNGVEANSHQFYPATSRPEAAVHPGIFRRQHGVLTTASIGPLGLGYRIGEVKRPFIGASA